MSMKTDGCSSEIKENGDLTDKISSLPFIIPLCGVSLPDDFFPLRIPEYNFSASSWFPRTSLLKNLIIPKFRPEEYRPCRLETKSPREIFSEPLKTDDVLLKDNGIPWKSSWRRLAHKALIRLPGDSSPFLFPFADGKNGSPLTDDGKNVFRVKKSGTFPALPENEKKGKRNKTRKYY